ncbi:arabinan endo-1,5-alpha-L-arabinosidase [Deinococcus altitudinis]|uniref:arabinan endo-1,5-alpha-L-arabinosidase n=1 Tax=Deinococcus altitudinis TaxID=468914 RepID=UPI003891CC8E
MKRSVLLPVLGAATLGVLALGVQASGAALPVQPTLKGDLDIHDPTLLKVADGYVAMGTGFEGIDGGTLRLKTSKDGVNWTDAGHLGDHQPAWVGKLLGQEPPNLWAPTLFQKGKTTYLYFAASTFGKNTSGIGLMTNPALSAAKPGVGWSDRGLVFASKRGDTFNAIDPYRIDTADGRAWLAFGSFWDGIKMRSLDPQTGLLNKQNATLYSLASRGGGAIEAASIVQHGRFFYLFVSFDRCCAGVSSTYRIMVGRSGAVTGPYTDKSGVPMMKGGGTQLQAGQGRFLGPGGQENYTDGGIQNLVYHYYDQDAGGASMLQTSPLIWGADGWPTLGALPEGTS